MPNGKEPLIVCENLVKIYKVADLEVVALQGLDLIVRRGEMVGIVGTSGSGKTTLMNILGGLDRPSAGRVTVDGLNLLTLSETALNHYQQTKVGFVWQQTSRNLIPYLTAQENIELPMTMAWHKQRPPKTRLVGRAAAGRGALRAAQAQPFPAFRRRAAAGGHCGVAGE